MSENIYLALTTLAVGVAIVTRMQVVRYLRRMDANMCERFRTVQGELDRIDAAAGRLRPLNTARKEPPA